MAKQPSPLRVLCNKGALVGACKMIQHGRDDTYIISHISQDWPGFSGPVYQSLVALARLGVNAVKGINWENPADPNLVVLGPLLPD